ncbi:hypothetical protein [Streptomyces sp. NPDC126514]|uniref:hypothetical protein n=1 Tax=Streptomyces sp. NPDC126514 TaxID=3155210 RepID=UPI0033307783
MASSATLRLGIKYFVGSCRRFTWRLGQTGADIFVDQLERTILLTSACSEASSVPGTARIPGRSWTVRLTGYGDRTATVTCSTAACRMPTRSKDLASLRAFAAQHAAAHAKAATPRPNAACHCGAEHCAAHEDAKVYCAGAVALILRHDPAFGRVWSIEEVCAACAPLIPHARIIARAATPQPRTARPSAAAVPAPARSAVPGGFSSPSPAEGDGLPRPRRSGSRPRRPRRGQAH